jgi:hypothetical protein
MGHIVGDLIKTLRLAVKKGRDLHFEYKEAGRWNGSENCIWCQTESNANPTFVITDMH